MNFHSIKVDRSVVGAINTGNVKKMEVALNNIHLTNQSPELEQHLKQFAEEVLAEAALSVDSKNEIVEQLSALAEQVAMPEESRIKGVMKALVMSIAASIVPLRVWLSTGPQSNTCWAFSSGTIWHAWNRALRSVDASDGVPMWHEFGLPAAGRPPLGKRDPSQCSGKCKMAA